MRKIYARATELVKLDAKEADTFVAANHRQSSLKTGAKVSYGLKIDDELVAVAQFGSPRTKLMREKYTVELLRLAFKEELRISGGASKLIKGFIKAEKPADLFTYQDTTGEVTDLYASAGMTLISRKSKPKQFLVAPGKTLTTASRVEALGMPYAVRYGPDRILGVKLGEVLDENGVRKSNKQLFIEELGWHIEETSGDRVYEWVDPNRTYYTYRTTASDSAKYYYGVSHVKIANATVADCKEHNYFVSGGHGVVSNKFINWRDKHKDQLQKEILSTHSRRAEAFSAEKKLVGELWKTDPNCLNSVVGGLNGSVGSLSGTRVSMKTCPIHGEAKHLGEKCYRCTNGASTQTKLCVIHGESKHRGDKCLRCSRAAASSIQECAIHGLSPHYGKRCSKCHNEANVGLKLCPIHGETKHNGDKCYSCTVENAISQKECTIHSVTSFRGDTCNSCIVEGQIHLSNCEVHGESKHRGTACLRCASKASFTVQTCSSHGETLFAGATCKRCTAEKAYSTKNCSIHGEATHIGDTCKRCAQAGGLLVEVPVDDVV
jgi:hypothetical protein